MKTNYSKSPSSATPVRAGLDNPSATDVLFGRGGESNNHLGNRHYQRVVEGHGLEYAQMKKRKDKTELSWQILKDLRKEGFRFLKKAKGSRLFFEVSDEEVRKKISQRLRERALDARGTLVEQEDESTSSDDNTQEDDTQTAAQKAASIFEPLTMHSADSKDDTSLMEAVTLLDVPMSNIPDIPIILQSAIVAADATGSTTSAPIVSWEGTLILGKGFPAAESEVVSLCDFEEEVVDYCEDMDDITIRSEDIFPPSLEES